MSLSFASEFVDVLFDSGLANDMTYLSSTIRCVPVAIDTGIETGGRFSSGRRPAKAFDILASSVASKPTSGQTVTVLGTVYKLQSDAYHPDTDNLIWRVECYEVSGE